jgi:hypothetical protein
MTPNDWWQVGSRLLGVYFLVIGALTAMGSLMFLGAEIPGTSRRWPFEAGYLLRAGDIAAGAISGAAGALLAFTPSRIADRLPKA